MKKYKNARCAFKWRMQICAKLLYLNCQIEKLATRYAKYKIFNLIVHNFLYISIGNQCDYYKCDYCNYYTCT